MDIICLQQKGGKSMERTSRLSRLFTRTMVLKFGYSYRYKFLQAIHAFEAARRRGGRRRNRVLLHHVSCGRTAYLESSAMLQ